MEVLGVISDTFKVIENVENGYSHLNKLKIPAH